MINIKNKDEIDCMIEAGRIVKETLCLWKKILSRVFLRSS